ncbi:uncharacterized protein LOC119557364 [Drosophila subpulchrella]|uniref:uncharacterized protein LOC119557364 n=1 Tax=Drosophila subpulchrella TaxID=1486046 RepID=UPI0018A1A381|nr:uncharacterized protein LOC119557364 [Drosophila subpulchrella]
MPKYPSPNKRDRNSRGEVPSVRGKQVEIPVKEAVATSSPRILEDCDKENASSKRANRSQRPGQSKKPKGSLKRLNFKKSDKCVAKRSTILMALQQNESLGDIVSERSPEPYKSVILRMMMSLGRGVFGFIRKSSPINLYNAEPAAENTSELMPQQSGSQEGDTANLGQLPLEENPPVLMPQQSGTQRAKRVDEDSAKIPSRNALNDVHDTKPFS